MISSLGTKSDSPDRGVFPHPSPPPIQAFAPGEGGGGAVAREVFIIYEGGDRCLDLLGSL